MEDYKKLFHERYILSDEIDHKFTEIREKEGTQKAIEYLKEMGAEWIDIENQLITLAINDFTKDCYTNNQKERKIKALRDGKYVKKSGVKKNPIFKKNEAFFETSNGIITAMPFSSIAKGVKNVFPYIETSEREGKCYTMSYGVSLCLGGGQQNDVVTGLIYGYSSKSKFLHSWVETNIGGKDYVIDSVLNAVINKEGYYAMKHAKELNRIDYKTLKADSDKYFNGKLDENQIPLEMYLTFRDEVIRDLEKNEQLFDER